MGFTARVFGDHGDVGSPEPSQPGGGQGRAAGNETELQQTSQLGVELIHRVVVAESVEPGTPSLRSGPGPTAPMGLHRARAMSGDHIEFRDRGRDGTGAHGERRTAAVVRLDFSG